MTKKSIIRLVIIVLCLAGGLTLAAMAGIRYYMDNLKVTGTITWLDPDTRRAAVEFDHPWKSKRMEITAKVPTDCDLKIGDRPARMEDVIPGDRAVIRASWNKAAKELDILSVRIQAANRPSRPVVPTQPADE